jgi:hypothetical protein
VAPPIVHDVLGSSGAPLDAAVRAEMEPRFGHSFADVRVHAEGRAAESAKAVGARAYAVGRDVVFGAGRYAPGSMDGRRLIAHELAHVVQQRGASASLQPTLEIGAANDPAEREADAAAEAVARGGSVAPPAAGAGMALRRDGEEDGRSLPNPARESRRRGPVDPIDMDENTPYLFFRFGAGGRFELIFRAPGTPMGAMGLGMRFQRRSGFAFIASADPLDLEDTYSPQDARALLGEIGERPEVEGPAAPRIPRPADEELAVRVLTARMSRALQAILQQRQSPRFQLRPPMTGTPGIPQPASLGLGLPPLQLTLPAGFEPAAAALPPPPRYRLRLRTPGWTPEPSSTPEGLEAPPPPRLRGSIGGGYNIFRSAAGPAPAVAPPIVHDVLRSSGAPLDAPLRGEMESRFGHSFADVRVHADSRAADSARAVGAHAYAVGRDVVFGAGRYAPGSIDGKRLIAHELAHVVQQRDSSPSLQPALEIGPVDDPAERQAERAADAVTHGLDAPAGRSVPAPAGTPVLRRAWWGGILGALGGGALGAGVGMALGGPVGAVIGGIVGGVGGLVAGDVATARRRPLTGEESAAAEFVFGDSLDTGSVRIVASPVMSVGNTGRTVDDQIYVSPRAYDEGLLVGWVIHELTHVWQKQHGISFVSRLVYALRREYKYGGEQGLLAARAAGKRFVDFNTEQQGDILEHYYNREVAGMDTAAWLPYVNEVRAS